MASRGGIVDKSIEKGIGPLFDNWLELANTLSREEGVQGSTTKLVVVVIKSSKCAVCLVAD